MANGPARPGAGRAITGRRASQAVPLQASCLAFGLGTALWAENRAGPARKARSVYQAVPARGLLRQKKRNDEHGRNGGARAVAMAQCARWRQRPWGGGGRRRNRCGVLNAGFGGGRRSPSRSSPPDLEEAGALATPPCWTPLPCARRRRVLEG